jgi:hypothetical protein
VENAKSFLQIVALVIVLFLLLYNIYTGATVQKIGIPGIAEVEFGQRASSDAPVQSHAVAPSQTPDQIRPPQPSSPSTPRPSAEHDSACSITITNPLVSLMREPEEFSQELIRVGSGTYPTTDYTETTFGNQTQGWFQVEVEGRTGWIKNDTWTIENKTSACP